MTMLIKERRSGKCACGGNQYLEQEKDGLWLVVCDKCDAKIKYRRGSDWKLPLRKINKYCAHCKRETAHKEVETYDTCLLRCQECGVCDKK